MNKHGPSSGPDQESMSIEQRCIPDISSAFRDKRGYVFTVNVHDMRKLSPPGMKISQDRAIGIVS